MKICGVTIVRQKNNKYELIARYDSDTDEISSNIKKALKYKTDNPDNIEYQLAAEKYYEHINYLIDTLKINNNTIFEGYDKLTVKDELKNVTYKTNDSLSKRIQELYEYSRPSIRNEKFYGTTPWNDNIAARLKSDLSGSESLELNGCNYDVEDYGGDKNLVSYLENKKFKEYIIEVSTGEITEQDILEGNDSGKLEIIYVEQQP